MDLLLTHRASPSLHEALVGMLDTPISESRALALRAVDGSVEVVSEGRWQIFSP